MSSDQGLYNCDTTTDEVLEGLDLAGKRIVITGSSSGLGEESARSLASKGASITMLARNPEKNEAAAARIRESVPNADLELAEVDLGSLASVRESAKGLLARLDRIDILINNAGVMCCPHDTTSDGFELQLGTNHIGHFLLTNLLVPALLNASPSRVVVLSSGAHGMAGIDFDDPMFERREYDPWLAYGQSKTANALFALQLDRLLSAKGISAYAVHPGMIMTELARHMTAETIAIMQKRLAERAEAAGEPLPDGPAGMPFKSVEAGAATQVWAATTSDLAEHGGAYLGDCQLGVLGGNAGERGFEPYLTNTEDAARLWSATEEWVGQRFEF